MNMKVIQSSSVVPLLAVLGLVVSVVTGQTRLEPPTADDLKELEGWKGAVLPGHSIDEEFFLYLIQSYRKLRERRGISAPATPATPAPPATTRPAAPAVPVPASGVHESKPTYFFRDGPLPDSKCVPVQHRVADFGNTHSACGKAYKDLDIYSVAIADGDKYCGREIIVDYNGKQVTLKVEDKCPGCPADQHIDASIEALHELFSRDAKKTCAIDSVTPPVKWWFK